MAQLQTPIAEAFPDSSYAIALSSPNDLHHAQASRLADYLEAQQTRLITTRAVLLEIGNALARLRHRRAAIALLDPLEADPLVEIIPLSEDLYARTLRYYRERPDKEWS